MSELAQGAKGTAGEWDWAAPADRGPSTAQQRTRGVIQALVGAAIGSLLFVFWSRVAGSVVGAIATIILLSALLSPGGVYATIDRLFDVTGHAIGNAITWVALPAMFYGFFWPFGALFRRGRRDPMRRFYEEDAATYWEDRERGRSASVSSQRQF